MRPTRFLRPAAALLAAPLLVLALGSCSDDGGDGSTVEVLAAFYPLQYAAERVGGAQVSVDNLTAPGAEPHDLELAPQDVAAVSGADLVVFMDGFQPAVDDAVDQTDGDRAFDVTPYARLDLTAPDHEGEDAGTLDPHFWLDPSRLAEVGDALAEQLATIDPDGAAGYRANAESLRADLEALDADYLAALDRCDSRDLVTSHTAFGYLAQRYDLTQVGIAGLSPDTEPTAAELADVTAYVRERGVTTIFYETLVSPDVAETVARETGATTAVLDPLEGLASADTDEDYLTVMRTNLGTLQTGLGCR